MDLIINNHIITYDMELILNKIKNDCHGRYLKNINRRGDNIEVTCPYHKEGKELHPSAYVYNRNDNDEIQYGLFHCFTCGEKHTLDQVVSYCLNISILEARNYLVDNFSDVFTERPLNLEPIIFHNENQSHYIDESILENYAYFHPYQFKRGLTEGIIKQFKVGYDKDTDSITFPVWDENDNLVGITKRNVNTKFFSIPQDMGKPVYLLNYIKKYGITKCCVCESQLDALYLWSCGYPAIALLGTGSKKQYDILNKCGIRFYILCLDGDTAGIKGTHRFKSRIRKDVIVEDVHIPMNRDVNDLSKSEIDKLIGKFFKKKY